MLGIFGQIDNPFLPTGLNVPGLATGSEGQGLIIIITNLVRLSIVIAGLYTLINIILAGYGFISAGGDSKLVQKSWERIWRSVLGLLIVTASIIIAMLIGWVFFGNVTAIIMPHIYSP